MYDWRKHTDEDLAHKLDQVMIRLNFAYGYGSADLLNSLMRAAQSIEEELHMRAAKSFSEAIIESSPTIIETDPDLAEKHKKEVAQIEEEDLNQVKRRKPTEKRSVRRPRPEDLNI